MEYQESGVIEVANDKGKFQSVKFRGRKDWFSNWLESNELLKVGDVVNFNYTEKGIYKNITNYEHANSAIAQAQQQKAFSKANTDYTKASDIPPAADALTHLPEVVGDAKKILNECKNAVLDVFGVEVLEAHQVACVNTLFIYSSKEIQFRK